MSAPAGGWKSRGMTDPRASVKGRDAEACRKERAVTAVFLGLLVLAWMVVLIPASIKRRRRLPSSSAERFRAGMGLLAGTLPGGGRWVMVPTSEERLRAEAGRRRLARRLATFKALLAGVAVSLPAAALSPELWNLHLLADATLVGYVAYLIGIKRRRDEAGRKISPLRSGPARLARSQGLRAMRERERADVGGSRA